MRAERSEGIARRAEQAVQRATDVRESCPTKGWAATQVNTLHKASLNLFRVVSVSVCVKPTPPHRLDLGVRGRGGAKVAACFESSARELGRTANSESESSSRMRP